MAKPFSHIELFWRTPGAFRLLFERLAARFMLITYDSRGTGSSTRGLKTGHSSRDFETDLEAVVDNLALPRFVLMGHNNFGRVAINYTALHPDRVLALVLWNADLGDPSVDKSYQPSQLEALASSNWDLFVETTVRTSWRPEDPAVARRFVHESITQEDWLTRTHAWREYSAVASLSKLRLPTLVIANASGELRSTQTASTFMATQIPEARLVIFDDDGGGLFSRQPELPPAIPLIYEFVREACGRTEADVDASAAQPARPVSVQVSKRQVEVLRLIAQGKTNREIAEELVLSERTVQRHIADLYAKIEARNRAEATSYALKNLL